MAAASVDRVMCVAAGFIAAALCEIDKYWMDGWTESTVRWLLRQEERERERESGRLSEAVMRAHVTM